MKTATSPIPRSAWNGLSQMPSGRALTYLTVTTTYSEVDLGIAIYNMRQGEGLRYETLFRDETVGALDAVNGKEYVRMLRRAMDLGGFHQVIFICHTPLVWELADRILSIGGGRVFVGDREAAITEPR
jgi:exonuclease SbcC